MNPRSHIPPSRSLGLPILASAFVWCASCSHTVLAFETNYTAFVLGQPNATAAAGSGCSFGEFVGYASFPDIGQGSVRAVLWYGSLSEMVVLGPSSSPESWAYDCADGQQVGYYLPDALTPAHAALWGGSASSMVDLHPWHEGANSPKFESVCFATDGGVQVGYGGSPMHALLWRGTAESVVDLHPTNANPNIQVYDETCATCVAGEFQGGYGVRADKPRAVIWTGDSQSVKDLHPIPEPGPAPAVSYWGSKVAGISCRGIAVGTVYIPMGPPRIHAAIWHGSAERFVDLHPQGFAWSKAVAVGHSIQVGSGARTNQLSTALAWYGTPDSAIELHSFLPTGFAASEAFAVDEFGNILGRATLADGSTSAVVWIPGEGEVEHPSLRIAEGCGAQQDPRLQLWGVPGKTYEIQRSDNLRTWTTLVATNLPGPLFYLRDSDATGSASRFYRAVTE